MLLKSQPSETEPGAQIQSHKVANKSFANFQAQLSQVCMEIAPSVTWNARVSRKGRETELPSSESHTPFVVGFVLVILFQFCFKIGSCVAQAGLKDTLEQRLACPHLPSAEITGVCCCFSQPG